MGISDMTRSSMRSIKKDYRVLELVVMGSKGPIISGKPTYGYKTDVTARGSAT